MGTGVALGIWVWLRVVGVFSFRRENYFPWENTTLKADSGHDRVLEGVSPSKGSWYECLLLSISPPNGNTPKVYHRSIERSEQLQPLPALRRGAGPSKRPPKIYPLSQQTRRQDDGTPRGGRTGALICAGIQAQMREVNDTIAQGRFAFAIPILRAGVEGIAGVPRS